MDDKPSRTAPQPFPFGFMVMRAMVAAAGSLLVGTALLLLLLGLIWSQADRLTPFLSARLSAALDAQVTLTGITTGWEEGAPYVKVAQWQLVLPDGSDYRGSAELRWQEGWPLRPRGWHARGEISGPGIAKATVAWASRGEGWQLFGEVAGWDGSAAQPLLAWLERRFGFPDTPYWQAQVAEIGGEARGSGREVAEVRLTFRELTLPVTATTPGVAGVSGEAWGSRAAGRFRVAAPQAQLIWPVGWFAEPRLVLTDLSWEGGWRYSLEAGYTLNTDLLTATAPQGQFTAAGTIAHLERPGAQHLEGYAVARNVALPLLVRYLPPQAVGEETAAWLKKAFPSGSVAVAVASIAGPPHAFPFRHGEGEFTVEIPIEQVPLRFAPDWPELKIERGLVRFRNEALEVTVAQAQTRQMRLSGITATIPDLEADQPVLLVAGTASGTLGQLLDYVRRTPLRSQLPLTELQRLRASGAVHLDLSLTIPLYEAEIGVAGQLKVSQVQVPAAQAGGLPLTAGEIALSFDANGITAGQGAALWGGMPVAIEWLGGDPPRLGVRGELDGARLAPLMGWPKGWLEGVFAVAGEVTLAEAETLVRLTSDGRGLALFLPDPLAKPASTPWPIEVSAAITPKGWTGSGTVGDRLRWQRLATGSWSAAVGAAAPLPSPAPQGALAVTVATLDLDRWLTVAAISGTQSQWPQVDLRAATLIWQQRQWHDLTLKVTPRGSLTTFHLTSQEVSGSGTVRLERGAVAAVEAIFARLWWPEAAQEASVVAALSPSFSPSDLPQVRLQIDDLRWGKKRLGTLTFVAHPTQKEWQVESLHLRAKDGFEVRAHGRWRPQAGANAGQSEWQATVASANWGKELAELWGIDGLEGGSGRVEFTLTWPGKPWDFSWSQVTGTGQLAIEKGVFATVEPGVGRLLSVVSLPMVLRRLQFDFRDLAAKGMAFDRVEGSFAINSGYLTTSDLTIDAPVALAQIAGTIDLVREQQELEIRVLPRLGNTAATALTFVNPVAGFLTYLAQQVVGDPLGALLVRRYRLVGSWADPQQVAVDEELRQPSAP